jgi:uncharacterized membrane protein YdjX (TVP38/TMEM64 family)
MILATYAESIALLAGFTAAFLVCRYWHREITADLHAQIDQLEDECERLTVQNAKLRHPSSTPLRRVR